MTLHIAKRPKAAADLIELASHIAIDSLAVAERFLAQVELTFKQIAENPGIGREWASRRPRLKGLRVWPISGFRNHLVFYRVSSTAVEVVRVLHGARDLNKALLEH